MDNKRHQHRRACEFETSIVCLTESDKVGLLKAQKIKLEKIQTNMNKFEKLTLPVSCN